MPKKDIPAYSPVTGVHYENWDALVAAEANGFVSVAMMTDDKGNQWPWMEGPFETEHLAKNAAATMRRKAKKDAHPRLKVVIRVRPIWKPEKERKSNVR